MKACHTQVGPIRRPRAKCTTSGSAGPCDTFLEATLLNTQPPVSLTKREMEILDLVINGLTNREIAQKLHRTERTVEYHRNHLMHKFEAKTAADLVKRAILSGMV